ncbi:MAG: enoyl-CoA hydratase/isomerase family protein [Deltaproteobacteria bacterium]|nr:enoyl-CoA hydratase/isomerase family protein [Myxococcales bacterium]MDP3212608.1 enoyl-CoA hydratase/isomerase family protein [Deltaproteobacteria bacterium]
MIDIVIEGAGRNALSTVVLTSLRDALRAAGDAPVLLRGAGGCFSAGLNLKEVASLDLGGMQRFLGLLEETFEALYLHPAPVVALVEGHAIAGGAVLALCCDWRVSAADEKARIGLNEVALGLQFPPKTWAIVNARLPPTTRERVLLGAGLHGPAEALSLGLLDEVSSEPDARARAVLATLAAHPREAYAATKRSMRAGVVALSKEATEAFATQVAPAWVSDAVKARMLAVLKPKG